MSSVSIHKIPIVKQIIEEASQKIKDALGLNVTLLVTTKGGKYTPATLVKTVCEIGGVQTEQVFGKGRSAEVIRARHLIIYFLKMDLGYSYAEIGRLIGQYDHTSAIAAFKRVISLLAAKDKYLMTVYNAVEEQLNRENNEV